MSGGKRFADDFDRIDAVKPNDRILIQDSDDGNVKFANPSQLAGSTGGGYDMPITMEYVTRNGDAKNTPAFRIKGLTGSVDMYRMFFYRHIRSQNKVRNALGGHDRVLRYGWIHPADGSEVYLRRGNQARARVMRNDNVQDEMVLMSEFALAPTNEADVFVLRHTGGERGSNMINPNAAVSAKDIVSPYVWLGEDGDSYVVRVSFGRTFHSWGVNAVKEVGTNGTLPLRNMGFALVRKVGNKTEPVTGVLPFVVRISMDVDRNGAVYIAYR